MAVNPTILNGVLLGVVALTNAIASYITNMLAAQRSDKVAQQLSRTTTSQSIKLDAIGDIADKTHKLVNSKMGEVLNALVISARALYNLDPSEPNLGLLKAAMKNATEHSERQANADKPREK